MAMDRRIPTGLTFSMFMAAMSLGTILCLWNTQWLAPQDQAWANVVHSAALMCFVWALAGHALYRWRQSFTATLIGRDLLGVLDIGVLVMGLLVFICMFFVSSIEAIHRTVEFRYGYQFRVNIWSGGLFDLAAICTAILLAYRRTRNRQLITALFWVVTFVGLWVVFRHIPAVREVRTASGYPQAIATDWPSPFILSSAVTLCVFTFVAGLEAYRRRIAAWPDNLTHLTNHLEAWPGFAYSAGLVGAMILVLGCLLVTQPITGLSMFLAGGSMLALAGRRWNENFADIGLALITLGVVSLTMFGLPSLPNTTGSYYTAIFGRIIIGLAIMTWFWHWLARVWEQQLDNGQPWTTAGRLIRVARRVGFIIAAIAVLVSIHLSLWPTLRFVIDQDNTTSRWVWGLAANGLLIIVLVGAAYRTTKPTLAWLALFALASLVIFAVIRSPNSPFTAWITVHWPIPIAITAGAMVLLASVALRTKQWRPFFEPLYISGILITPFLAILGTLPAHSPTIPTWLPAATYGILTAVYLLAAFLVGPRTFSAVAVICAAVALWRLKELRASPSMDSGYARGALVSILAGASLWLMSMIYRTQAPAGIARLMKWCGSALLVAGVITHFVIFHS